jgi:hypothetical protein
MSTGRGNSFARKLDGDCGWVKDPQQSGNASNNTPGETSDVNYTLTIVQSMDCDNTHGSIDIFVNVGAYTEPVFPMKYVIAFDADNNGIFDFSDTYTYGADSTPPSVAITGLPLGRYKITVESVNGCFLRTFDITILECNPLLSSQLVYFKLLKQQTKTLTFEWLMGDVSLIRSLHLEKSKDGNTFITAATLESLNFTGSRLFTQTIPGSNGFHYYRLRITDKNGKVSFSPVVRIQQNIFILRNVGPNPVADKLLLQLYTSVGTEFPYIIYDLTGRKAIEGVISLTQRQNLIEIPVQRLSPGIYQLFFTGPQPVSLRFVKH